MNAGETETEETPREMPRAAENGRSKNNFALTFVLFAFPRLRCSCRVHANGFRCKCNGTRSGWNRNVGGSIGGTIRALTSSLTSDAIHKRWMQ
jgi:hypothetical protein